VAPAARTFFSTTPRGSRARSVKGRAHTNDPAADDDGIVCVCHQPPNAINTIPATTSADAVTRKPVLPSPRKVAPPSGKDHAHLADAAHVTHWAALHGGERQRIAATTAMPRKWRPLVLTPLGRQHAGLPRQHQRGVITSHVTTSTR